MKYLGLIPARRGSKRVPEKNIKSLCGKPLMAYTIEAALASSHLDRIIVSTEDEQISSIAQQWGAEVPFRRPNELATDDARSVEVGVHALEWLRLQENYSPDALVLLQPTCPLRTGRHIDEAIELYEARHADCVVAVSEPKHHPYWMKSMDQDGQLMPLMEADLHRHHQKQTLPKVWSSNSSIYIVRRAFFLAGPKVYGGRTYGYRMSPSESLDIDTPWDFYLAALILAARYRNTPNDAKYNENTWAQSVEIVKNEQ
jgi:CMP-N-acetylneuraminic acid synthetase